MDIGVKANEYKNSEQKETFNSKTSQNHIVQNNMIDSPILKPGAAMRYGNAKMAATLSLSI